MTRSDQPGDPGDERDVDFVVGVQDDADEELPQLSRVTPNSRLRVGVGVAALVLLVAILVARAALSSDSAPQAARTPSATPSTSVSADPTSTPSPSPSFTPSTGTTRIELPAEVPTRRGRDPQKCPGLRCSSSPALPGSVLGAVQAAFPESTIERAVTVRLHAPGHVLWYRELDVMVASEFLTLRIEAPARGQHIRSGFRTDHGEVTTYDEAMLGPWHVTVDVVDRLGGRADLRLLRGLATDARIAAV